MKIFMHNHIINPIDTGDQKKKKNDNNNINDELSKHNTKAITPTAVVLKQWEGNCEKMCRPDLLSDVSIMHKSCSYNK